MIKWTYKNAEINSHNDLPKEVTHIVYLLTFTDNTKYIGYKTVRAERRLKPTKKQLAIRKNFKRVEVKDLPFINYVGSSRENEGKELVSKEILYLTTNKRTATYLEVREMMTRRVVETSEYNNANINGKWFDNCLDGLFTT